MLVSCLFLIAGVDYTFRTGEIQITEKDGFNVLKIDGGQTWGQPGDPALPWIGVKLLLPLGSEASSVNIQRNGARTITLTKQIEPLQQQYPLSTPVLMPRTLANPEVYSRDAAFPEVLHNGLRTEIIAGHGIAFTAISPVDYNPVRNELTVYSEISVSVETQSSFRLAQSAHLLKQDSFISKFLKRSVDNIGDVPQYQYRTEGYEYIIIIDQAKYDQWLPLYDFYTGKGLCVLLKPIQEITTQYTGVDTQEKIRNYIIAMYAQNSLRYVLLAADTDVIPHRGLYVNFSQAGQIDADIPADMYYSCLDGNWNNDGDSYWGEMYEADLAPEIAIGRFCYNSNTEIGNFINKVMMYHITPVENELKSSLFVGEWLWDGPTWGGTYMDEMIGGSSMHGYTTVGVPTTWEIETLYDRTYGAENSWGPSQIRPLLSDGYNLVNHLGHSNTTYNMRLNNNQVSATTITNNGSNHNFSIYFTQGCYAGAFDNRDTSVGTYVGDCITEKFTSIATAAAGMISHSRYGWGMQGSTNGASQYFHRQYIDAIFGESIFDLGYTLVDSKIDNIPYISNSPVMFWVTYETNLTGDPAMMIWTDIPQQLTAQLPNAWLVGATQYQISTNAPNANFRIKQGAELLFETDADATGFVTVNLLEGLNPGTYELYLTAPNFYSYSTSFEVIASQIAYIIPTTVTPIDDDGLLHAGENISLNVTLQNVGMVNQVSSGILTISSASPHISVFQSSVNFNAISSGSTINLNDVFEIGINTNFTDGAIVPIVFTAQYDEFSTQTTSNLILNAPILSVESYSLGGGSGIILPGRTVNVNLTIDNDGSGIAFSPMMILIPDSPMISVSEYEVVFPPIDNDSQVTFNSAFSVTVSADAEIGSMITIPYFIGAENGTGSEGMITLYIGVINYTFENDLPGWTSSAPTNGFTNQWHRSDANNNTPNGSFSMKFGGTGTANYANSAYGALDSPEMPLGQNSQLKFYHRMAAETHNTATGMAWDGGLVQMSIDGGAWTQITPVGGYPYRIYNNPASPFTANTWVYSGTYTWQLAIFDIPQTSGMARFRFLFGSDGNTTGEGWYIDDVRVEADFVDNDDLSSENLVLGLSNYPNPFNPSTTIKFSIPMASSVSLEIYNVKGQKVRTLANNSQYPSGIHHLVWNGRDDHNAPVSSGVYFYKLNTAGKSITKKMLMMK